MSRDANVQAGTEQGQIAYIYFLSRSCREYLYSYPPRQAGQPVVAPGGIRNGCGAKPRKVPAHSAQELAYLCSRFLPRRKWIWSEFSPQLTVQGTSPVLATWPWHATSSYAPRSFQRETWETRNKWISPSRISHQDASFPPPTPSTISTEGLLLP